MNTYIYHGAASSTEAKEVGGGIQSAGAFTTAFMRHMKTEHITLDELSELIRTDMTADTEEDYSTTSKLQRAGTERSQRSQRSVQISPTENFLEHGYRGWCFFESTPMCFGLVSTDCENYARAALHCDTTECRSTTAAEEEDEWADKQIEMPEMSQRSQKSNLPRMGSVQAEKVHMDETNINSTLSKPDAVTTESESQPGPPSMNRKSFVGNAAPTSAWVEFKDNQGRSYYHNKTTKKTQWSRPAEMGTPAPPTEGGVLEGVGI